MSIKHAIGKALNSRRGLSPLFMAIWLWCSLLTYAQPLSLDDIFLEEFPDTPAPAKEKHRFITPYSQGVERIIEAAQAEGWATIRDELGYITMEAHRESSSQLHDWYYLYAWADLFAHTEAELTRNWLKFNHSDRLNLPLDTTGASSQSGTLGERYPADFLQHIMGKLAFSRNFFETIQHADYLPGVINILHELYRKQTAYTRYENLALAIAVVYDVAPPDDWPHGQVSVQQLPRTQPQPAETFRYFSYLNDRGQAQIDLSTISVTLLKYLVATPTPFSELDWVRTEHPVRIDQLENAYSSIPYDLRRYLQYAFTWQAKDYKLQTILAHGGICVDQAYYAKAVATAHGIPAAIIRGAGNDGRHAWLGHSGSNGNTWSNEVGRFGANRYVQGFATDPQTWQDITEESLTRQATTPSNYPDRREAAVITGVAELFFRAGEVETSRQLLREATQLDHTYRRAWLYLAYLALQHPTYEDEVIDVYQNAMLAFSADPEERAQWSLRLSKYLTQTGREAQAQYERYAFSVETRLNRIDLAIRSAAQELAIARTARSPQALESLYKTSLRQLGKSGGMDYFDAVVRPHVLALLLNAETAAAQRAIDFAIQTFEADPGTMLHREAEALKMFVNQNR